MWSTSIPCQSSFWQFEVSTLACCNTEKGGRIPREENVKFKASDCPYSHISSGTVFLITLDFPMGSPKWTLGQIRSERFGDVSPTAGQSSIYNSFLYKGFAFPSPFLLSPGPLFPAMGWKSICSGRRQKHGTQIIVNYLPFIKPIWSSILACAGLAQSLLRAPNCVKFLPHTILSLFSSHIPPESCSEWQIYEILDEKCSNCSFPTAVTNSWNEN